MRYGFVIDHHSCIGCHACTVACKSENEVPVGSFRTWVKYTEIGVFPTVRRHFAVLRCNHCTKAPCVTICPVNALEKRADGIVDLDKDACIGCKACMQACPYDAIYLNEDTGGAEKCHYCAHRVEQNLEPACVTVCPEQAIIAGDLDDPGSRIAQYAARDDARRRRVEQGTEPNVFYVGVDDVSLQPGTAVEPQRYLWSDRRVPPPDWPADREDLQPQAVTVLDVNHDVHWKWPVSLYLVTKGVAAGPALLAPFLAPLGVTGFAADWLPESLALVFTGVTGLLLVGDLKRPMLFFRLLTRPNTRSWLVKGAWVLTAFIAVSAAILALRLLGFGDAAGGLRWLNLAVGAGAAGYTAFLFGQCEGRDLWQSPRLLPHLLLQALLLGAVTLAAAAPVIGLAAIAVLAALGHLGFALAERFGRHHTSNARQAASLLPRIPVWRGSRWRAFSEGLQFSTVAPALALVLFVFGYASIPAAAILCAATWLGMFWYEQAFVRAAQLPPLS